MEISWHACFIPLLTFIRVRSFDINHRETIQFHTPLTLIVGYNGSGKTVGMALNIPRRMLRRFIDDHRMSQICHHRRSPPKQQRRGFHSGSKCMFLKGYCTSCTRSKFLAMWREGRSRTSEDVVQRHHRSEDGNHEKFTTHGEEEHSAAKDARMFSRGHQRRREECNIFTGRGARPDHASEPRHFQSHFGIGHILSPGRESMAYERAVCTQEKV